MPSGLRFPCGDLLCGHVRAERRGRSGRYRFFPAGTPFSIISPSSRRCRCQRARAVNTTSVSGDSAGRRDGSPGSTERITK